MAWAPGAVYLASAAACCALAARSSAHFVDIQVYRMGGAAVLHGEDLYRLRLGVLPFTYPPFAAVLLTALAVVPFGAVVVLLTGASVAALPVTLYLALRPFQIVMRCSTANKLVTTSPSTSRIRPA